MLTPDERRELLSVARNSIQEEMRRRHTAGSARPDGRTRRTAGPESRLDQPGGAFVTLHLGGELRGCIGYIEYPGPLRSAVEEVAQRAAFEDPRFSPVTPDELDAVTIEISVMSPLHRITGVADVKVGRDGLVVELGRHRGLLLPQVASEYHWEAGEFLENTARKAGLPADAWRDPKAELYAFEAEVFSEDSAKA